MTLTRAADRAEDTFPHGTKEGYDLGCRGGSCPTGEELGLSCLRARTLAAGDYRYQKLVRAGATPAQIADELGLNPEIAPARAPRPTPAPDVPVFAPEPAPAFAPESVSTTAPAAKWAIRHSWVAFAPDGTMHGPFGDHTAALTFVGHELQAAAMPKQRRRVSDAEIAQIRTLNAEGLSDSEIARRLGRAQGVVSMWRRRLKLPTTGRFGGAQ